jgi:hypothetical protein
LSSALPMVRPVENGRLLSLPTIICRLSIISTLSTVTKGKVKISLTDLRRASLLNHRCSSSLRIRFY